MLANDTWLIELLAWCDVQNDTQNLWTWPSLRGGKPIGRLGSVLARGRKSSASRVSQTIVVHEFAQERR